MTLRRTALVAVLGAWALIATLSGFLFNFIPTGHFGFSLSPELVVTGVFPQSSAEAAGILPGDRFDATRMTPQQIRLLRGTKAPGATIRVPVVRNGVSRDVVLVARTLPVRIDPLQIFQGVSRILTAIVFLGLSGFLYVVRPGIVTQSFFLFAVGACATIYGPSSDSSPPPLGVFIAFLNAAAAFLFGYGACTFAIVFPDNLQQAWRRNVLSVVPWICLIPAGAILVQQLEAVRGATSAALSAANGTNGWFLGTIMTATAAIGALFIANYATNTAENRKRMQWVILGSVIAILALPVDLVFQRVLQVDVTFGQWFDSISTVLIIFVPISVFYAILKHRVIDVRVIISRAVAYALLTGSIVGFIALVDWISSQLLSRTRLGVATEMLLAIALGFWLNGLHRRIERFADAVFFRTRHAAAVQLQRAANALRHANSRDAVAAMLVEQPMAALDLASTALFRREGDGFVRERAEGWNAADCRALDADDRLVLHMEAEQRAIRTADLLWPCAGLPPEAARPVLAMPVVVRRRVRAIVLYGPHRNGADIDSEEEAMLARLDDVASSTYDHLEAIDLKRELTEVSAEVAVLRGLRRA